MNDREHISRWNLVKRNIFIKKRFQADFAVKVLILIVIESLLAIGLFVYLSRGTVITGYSGSEVVIASTGEYFLPTLLLTNLVVIGLTAVVGFVVMLLISHKIAGPLYRFEKSLEETSKGDLTNRFNLRSDDQMHDLAEKMNQFNYRIDGAVSRVQRELVELSVLLDALHAEASDGADLKRINEMIAKASDRVKSLKESATFFKTSYTTKGKGL